MIVSHRGKKNHRRIGVPLQLRCQAVVFFREAVKLPVNQRFGRDLNFSKEEFRGKNPTLMKFWR
jgi:hypothetical protein